MKEKASSWDNFSNKKRRIIVVVELGSFDVGMFIIICIYILIVGFGFFCLEVTRGEDVQSTIYSRKHANMLCVLTDYFDGGPRSR